MGKKTAKSNSVGKALYNARENATRSRNFHASSRHCKDQLQNDQGRSVVDESALNEFLASAQLSGKQFVAERILTTSVVENKSAGGVTSKSSEGISTHELQIPRRPMWTRSMSAAELERLENDAFIEWRRKLAELEQMDNVTLTPFERNLEFWRQLWRVVERSDVVVQILDGRNPELFRCPDLEKFVIETGRRKRNFLLLNKADLLTVEQRSVWAEYFRSLNIPVAFFSALFSDEAVSSSCTKSTTSEDHEDNDNETKSEDGENNDGYTDDSSSQQDLNNVEGDEVHSDSDSSWETDFETDTASLASSSAKNTDINRDLFWSSKLLSVADLIEVLKAVGLKSHADSTVLTVGMVGYPNVGKSSTINKILGCKKVPVSATPGKTKHFQTLYLDDTLMLCDCPGLVMPSFTSSRAEMLLWGILPIDQMRDGFEPVSLICKLIPRHVLCQAYGVVLPAPKDDEAADAPPTALEFLTVYAFLRGFMSSKGLPDWQRASRYIVKDFTNGKLLYCVPPKNSGTENFNVWKQKPCVEGSVQKLAIYENATLQTLAKRHLLDMDKKTEQIDSHFFPNVSKSGAFVRGSKSPMIAKSEEAAGKPWKKHNNANRKQKLRRQFGHLDI